MVQNHLSDLSAGVFSGDQSVLFSTILKVRLNRSKCSNELFGHLLVDEVMKLVVQRIKSALNAKDHCFSVTDDEVAIVFDSCGASDVLKIMGSLVDLIQRAYVIHGKTIFLSANIGIALATQNETE